MDVRVRAQAANDQANPPGMAACDVDFSSRTDRHSAGVTALLCCVRLWREGEVIWIICGLVIAAAFYADAAAKADKELFLLRVKAIEGSVDHEFIVPGLLVRNDIPIRPVRKCNNFEWNTRGAPCPEIIPPPVDSDVPSVGIDPQYREILDLERGWNC